MLPCNPGGHSAYQDTFISDFLKFYPDPLKLCKSTWDYIVQFWYLDLSQTDSIMRNCYSVFGPEPRLPSCMPFPASGSVTPTTFLLRNASQRSGPQKDTRKALRLPVILPALPLSSFLYWNVAGSDQKILFISFSDFMNSSSSRTPSAGGCSIHNIWPLPVTALLYVPLRSSAKNESVTVRKLAYLAVTVNGFIHSPTVTGDGIPTENAIFSVTTSTCMWLPTPIATFPFSRF